MLCVLSRVEWWWNVVFCVVNVVLVVVIVVICCCCDGDVHGELLGALCCLGRLQFWLLCCCLGLLWLWWGCCGWCCWCCGGVVWCFGHVSDLVKGCGGFEMESLVFIHCSVLKMGITLSFLRLKLWGLLFWKACFMLYQLHVLSFRIWAAEILWNWFEMQQFSGIREWWFVIFVQCFERLWKGFRE